MLHCSSTDVSGEDLDQGRVRMGGYEGYLEKGGHNSW